MPAIEKPDAAARAALCERLQSMPAAMREREQWLLWRLEQKPTRSKPDKVPYYADGTRRAGGQGDEKDRAKLQTFDRVMRALAGGDDFDGVGFAFLPGDGIVAIDIDGAIDPETGEVAQHCTDIVEACASYTERSPSGKGIHIIALGESQTNKHDRIGVELYCGSQFFTCTGDHWGGTPADLQPIKPFALKFVHGMVDASKEAAKREKEAARKASAPPPAPAAAKRPAGDRDDFRAANDAALQYLSAWVPALLPEAREWRGGYRITSKQLGRDLEEDLQLMPEGIMDFGLEQGFSPIDIVMQHGRHATAKSALEWLAPRVGVELVERGKGLRLVKGGPTDRRPEPPPEGELRAADAAAAPAASPDDESADDADDEASADTSEPEGRSKRKPKEIDWVKFAQLREDFALIYGTDTVWDGRNQIIMKIANMGHAHGSDMVRLWKGGQASEHRSDGVRWTVMPDRVVFDPTESCDPDTHINLFNGFKTVPKAGDVQPLLGLISFLLSRVAESADDRDAIMHYLLCWLAYPLQHLGAKLRTAVVMHGDEGAGKNFLTDLVVEIYGQYGVTVGQDELEDKFNDWRSRKLFVVGDEVSSRAELVHNKNRLKALITSATVQINPKNLPRREEANHINVWFNSNELQPLALDNSDRRYLVIYTPKARDFDYYRQLGEWKRNGGMAAFYQYLLDYPCEDFEPFAPAPLTEAKRELIDMNRKSPERFWLEWSRGELDLRYMSCTAAQAYQAYLKYAQRTGDRFPMQRNVFTRMVLRISDSEGRPMVDKTMKVDYSRTVAGSVNDTRATRMLLVLPPPDQEQGAWATDCWETFEAELRRYTGHGGGGHGSGSSGDPGAEHTNG